MNLFNSKTVRMYEKKLKSDTLVFLNEFKKRYDVFPWTTVAGITRIKGIDNEVVKVNSVDFTVRELLKQISKFKNTLKAQLRPNFFDYIIKAFKRDSIAFRSNEQELGLLYKKYDYQLKNEFKKMDLNLNFCLEGFKAINKLLEKRESVDDDMSNVLYDITYESTNTLIDRIKTPVFNMPADFSSNSKQTTFMYKYGGNMESFNAINIPNDQVSAQINNAVSSYPTINKNLTPLSSLSQKRFAIIIPAKSMNTVKSAEQRDLIQKYNNHLLTLYYNKNNLAIIVAIPVVNGVSNPKGIKISLNPGVKLKSLSNATLTDIDKTYYISAILLQYNMCIKDYGNFCSRATVTPTVAAPPAPAQQSQPNTENQGGNQTMKESTRLDSVKESIKNELIGVYKENYSNYEKYNIIKDKIYEKYCEGAINLLEREDMLHNLANAIYKEAAVPIDAVTAGNNVANDGVKAADQSTKDIDNTVKTAQDNIQKSVNSAISNLNTNTAQ